ncbi:CAP domain-containing protein [Salinicoccus siamensis]|uniref:CAP domain-containing protein n=1 Tax=Salinicoccus siamensis TaxID=381830 RepID=A0ABV5Z5A6_9STAP
MIRKVFMIVILYFVWMFTAPVLQSYDFEEGMELSYLRGWLEENIYPSYNMDKIHQVNSDQTQEVEIALDNEYDTTGKEHIGSEYEGEFYIESEPGVFHMVLVKDQRVVGAYTNSGDVSVETINIEGLEREQVDSIYGTPESTIKKGWKRLRVDNEEYAVYDINGTYVYFFYDLHKSDQVNGLLVVDKEAFGESSALYNHPEPADNSKMNHLLVNATRQEYGLEPLSWDEAASKAALGHSSDMVEKDYFNHDSPDGVTLKSRLESADVSYRMAGENIAMGHTSPIFSHHSLMNSPPHRENTLKASFTHLGVGTAYNEENVPYYTENYIRK